MERYSFRRRKWIVQKRLEGWKVRDIIKKAKIPRQSFYNQWWKYKKEGFEGLRPKKTGPKGPRKKK